MKKKVATIILNRNLPVITNNLYEHIEKYDSKLTDIFVVDAGSNNDNISKYTTWHVDDPEVVNNGLRYCRGMNFALSELWKNKNFAHYDAFFLLTNDTELENKSSISKLINIMEENQSIGILSPCGSQWGERLLLEEQTLKFFWYIHNSAFFLRRQFIESICNKESPDTMNFIFDGNNFRGYQADTELIAKAYINDWSAAITSEVIVNENESYLLNKSDLIKTETYDENLKLYISEGKVWMKNKYGFNSRWSFQKYVKMFYDEFFYFHPELIKYKI